MLTFQMVKSKSRFSGAQVNPTNLENVLFVKRGNFAESRGPNFAFFVARWNFVSDYGIFHLWTVAILTSVDMLSGARSQKLVASQRRVVGQNIVSTEKSRL